MNPHTRNRTTKTRLDMLRETESPAESPVVTTAKKELTELSKK